MARVDHFRSAKVIHAKNGIWRTARIEPRDFILAEGVRFAVPSSAPQARKLVSLQLKFADGLASIEAPGQLHEDFALGNEAPPC